MKRFFLLNAIFVIIIALSISCTNATVNDSTNPEQIVVAASDNLPPSYTNDESENAGTYEGGQENKVKVPSISGSYAAKDWMHTNLPTWGPHFKTWLGNNGYPDLRDWSGPDGSGNPGFGGYQSNTAPSGSKKIIVLIHGNGSKAQGATGDPRGWYDTYKKLRDNGWNNSEIYAINYLPSTSVLNAAFNDHRSEYTNRVKRFLQAVYAYVSTWRPGIKLTVIAHSLGVTVTRKAMVDGNLYGKVETFISISGGNSGLLSCGTYFGAGLAWSYLPYDSYVIQTSCSTSTGFSLPVPYKLELWYGVYYIWGPDDITEMSLNTSLQARTNLGYWSARLGWVTGFYNSSALTNSSYFMGNLNYADRQFKYGASTSTRAYTIVSELDQIVGIRYTLYGQRWWSARLAGEYGSAIYNKAGYGHFGMKSKTTSVQLQMINRTYSGVKSNPS